MPNVPRSDELSALEALIRYWEARDIPIPPKIIFEPNGVKTAPDYLFDFSSHCALVEVRNSGDGFIVLPKSELLVSKEHYERSAAGMVDKIESFVKVWLDLYDDNYDGRLTTTMMAGQGFPFGKL